METIKDKQIETYLGERFEFKYILSLKQAKQIEAYIQAVGLTLDPYNKKNGPYNVNSLYFDTPTLEDYRDKDGSFNIRKKLRARIYTSKWSDVPEKIWLEVKKKRNMNIKKVRVGVNKEVWNNILNSKQKDLYGFIPESLKEEEDFKEFIYRYKRQLYRPHVVVTYDRTAYMSNFLSPIRVTFDKNVRVCKADTKLDVLRRNESIKLPVTKDRVILEIKFNGKLPWWFTKIITKFDIQRDDFSKYRNSVAMLRGVKLIPVNK